MHIILLTVHDIYVLAEMVLAAHQTVALSARAYLSTHNDDLIADIVTDFCQ